MAGSEVEVQVDRRTGLPLGWRWGFTSLRMVREEEQSSGSTSRGRSRSTYIDGKDGKV